MKNIIRTVLICFFVACCTISCKKDGASLKGIEFEEEEITLSVGEKYSIELFAVPHNADLPECSFSSDDRKVATVDRATGEITAVGVGEAVITAKTPNSKHFAECYVTVLPAGNGGSNLYREPYLTFGASKTTVKNYETRELGNETTDMLLFLGENKDVFAVAYSFKASKMDLILVAFENTTNIKNKAINHLSAKYEYLGEEDGEYYFVSSNGKIGILLFYDDEDLDCWLAFYVDLSSATSVKSSLSKNEMMQRLVISERISTLLGKPQGEF